MVEQIKCFKQELNSPEIQIKWKIKKYIEKQAKYLTKRMYKISKENQKCINFTKKSE